MSWKLGSCNWLRICRIFFFVSHFRIIWLLIACILNRANHFILSWQLFAYTKLNYYQLVWCVGCSLLIYFIRIRFAISLIAQNLRIEAMLCKIFSLSLSIFIWRIVVKFSKLYQQHHRKQTPRDGKQFVIKMMTGFSTKGGENEIEIYDSMYNRMVNRICMEWNCILAMLWKFFFCWLYMGLSRRRWAVLFYWWK